MSLKKGWLKASIAVILSLGLYFNMRDNKSIASGLAVLKI
jgi:hypothetical protein